MVREGSTLGPAVNDDRDGGELAHEICATFDVRSGRGEGLMQRSPRLVGSTPRATPLCLSLDAARYPYQNYTNVKISFL